MKSLDISGSRYGMLTVLDIGDIFNSPSRKHVTWNCICDCGNKTTVRLNSLRSGIVRSCGCLRGKTVKHGKSKTPEYITWARMKDRCLNEKSKSFGNYGGRGISVCEEWIDSFETFYSDMGVRPSKNHSIDRIDVNGNYEKNNCRWATIRQQSLNKRTNRYIEFNGAKKTLTEWAESIGITQSSMSERLLKQPVHIALTQPKRI
jgi:hypothetical protein